MKQGWLCRCGTRNQPTHRKCRGDGCNRSRPKRRVPKHAEVLRDMSYDEAARESQRLHGGELHACGVCGRPRGDRNHDRDHDHRTGKFRGLACWRCNREWLRGHDLQSLDACSAYLRRGGAV